MLLPKYRNLAFRMLSTAVENKDVIFQIQNNIGIIILNRPKVLNSLNESMVTAIYNKLKEWESQCSFIVVKSIGSKAFCAGGDVVSATRDKNQGKAFFQREYKMNHLIGTYKIPYISICDGITMGGGVGISVHGRYRIATPKTLFAMPETAIGLFPDVGGSYVLPRLPGKLGLFLGLTGYRLSGADVIKAGIATHFITTENLKNLECELLDAKADEIPRILKRNTIDVSDHQFCLNPYLDTINTCFSAESVEEIHELLFKDGSKWAVEILEMLAKLSPSSLKITKRELELGAAMDLQQCLKMEYRLANAALEQKISHDFYEGVRALLIDKDRNPKWKPLCLSEVTDEMVNKCFEFLPTTDELDI